MPLPPWVLRTLTLLLVIASMFAGKQDIHVMSKFKTNVYFFSMNSTIYLPHNDFFFFTFSASVQAHNHTGKSSFFTVRMVRLCNT